MKALIDTVALALAATPTWASVKCVDDKGVSHPLQSEAQIPEKYLNKTEQPPLYSPRGPGAFSFQEVPS